MRFKVLSMIKKHCHQWSHINHFITDNNTSETLGANFLCAWAPAASQVEKYGTIVLVCTHFRSLDFNILLHKPYIRRLAIRWHKVRLLMLSTRCVKHHNRAPSSGFHGKTWVGSHCSTHPVERKTKKQNTKLYKNEDSCTNRLHYFIGKPSALLSSQCGVNLLLYSLVLWLGLVSRPFH